MFDPKPRKLENKYSAKTAKTLIMYVLLKADSIPKYKIFQAASIICTFITDPWVGNIIICIRKIHNNNYVI